MAELLRGYMGWRLLLRRTLARKPWQPLARLRARADRLRQARSFREAEAVYRLYLARRPDHAMAWTMLGHCLREQHRYPDADRAYAKAVSIDPRDPYHSFVRGNFLLDLGHGGAAAALLRQAAHGEGYALVAKLHAERGLPALTPAADADPGDAPVWIDLQDLLHHLRHSGSLTGIQRVVLSLAQAALDEPGRAACVTGRGWDARLWSLPRGRLGEILKLADAGRGGSHEMREAIDAMLRDAAVATLRPGLRYLQPGSFTFDNGNPPLLLALHRAGAAGVAVIHDLFPYQHPAFFMPDPVREFTGVLGEQLLGLHGAIANSLHTAASIEATVARHGLPPLPVAAVPLAHTMRPPGTRKPVWPPVLRGLKGERFVLSVGTVEVRKNHAFIVRVWSRLQAEGLQPPPLILAGRQGWKTVELETALAEAGAASDLVRIIPGLTDDEIEALYRGCLFTVYPSLIEGWGLPIGESLAAGRLCVASDRGAMREVGGDFALYIDPEDVEAALPLFRDLLGDTGLLEACEARLREEFTPRGWPEVGAQMLAACEGFAPGSRETPRPLLPPGLRYDVAPLMGPSALPFVASPVAHPLRMILAEGWLRHSNDGCYMDGQEAWLHVTTDRPGTLCVALAAAQAVRVLVDGAPALDIARRGYGMLRLALPAGGHSIRLEARPVHGTPGAMPWMRAVSVELRAEHTNGGKD
jgi:glycosyltransferase involved in cell wall biosynthesis